MGNPRRLRPLVGTNNQYMENVKIDLRISRDNIQYKILQEAPIVRRVEDEAKVLCMDATENAMKHASDKSKKDIRRRPPYHYGVLFGDHTPVGLVSTASYYGRLSEMRYQNLAAALQQSQTLTYDLKTHARRVIRSLKAEAEAEWKREVKRQKRAAEHETRLARGRVRRDIEGTLKSEYRRVEKQDTQSRRRYNSTAKQSARSQAAAYKKDRRKAKGGKK